MCGLNFEIRDCRNHKNIKYELGQASIYYDNEVQLKSQLLNDLEVYDLKVPTIPGSDTKPGI